MQYEMQRMHMIMKTKMIMRMQMMMRTRMAMTTTMTIHVSVPIVSLHVSLGNCDYIRYCSTMSAHKSVPMQPDIIQTEVDIQNTSSLRFVYRFYKPAVYVASAANTDSRVRLSGDFEIQQCTILGIVTSG